MADRRHGCSPLPSANRIVTPTRIRGTEHGRHECADLGPEIKRKVLLENPAAYYGLDLDADITETPAA